MSMKTILVATDYSATADNAVKFAANLAKVFKAELILFNTFRPTIQVSNALTTPEVLDHLKRKNKDRLNALAKETAKQYQIEVQGVTRTLDTVDNLEDYTTWHKADLVVMGMDSNLTEYKVFGNTTTAVIRRLRTPTLVVPNNIEYNGIKKILYACEPDFVSEKNHLGLLEEITRQFAAQLQVLHVETKEVDAVAVGNNIHAMHAVVKQINHSYNVIENASVGDGIMQGVKEWQADLLVMVPHRPGFWERLFNGSTTRELTLRTRVPLLVLPNAD
jgi:nucleotide-binding universal stress UspA family protein